MWVHMYHLNNKSVISFYVWLFVYVMYVHPIIMQSCALQILLNFTFMNILLSFGCFKITLNLIIKYKISCIEIYSLIHFKCLIIGSKMHDHAMPIYLYMSMFCIIENIGIFERIICEIVGFM